MDVETSSTNIDTARDALRQAHQAREAARSQLESVEAIAARGRELVEQMQLKLAERAAEAEEAQRELSVMIADRLRAGAKAELGSPRLARCEEEHAKVSSKHQVARRAHEQLRLAAKEAHAAVAAAEAAVRSAAVGVLAAEATVRAGELRKAREVVGTNQAWLLAVGNLPLGNLGAPLRPAVSIALEEQPQLPPQFSPEVRALGRLRLYLEALQHDADVQWEAIEEPTAVAVSPQVVFRPSFEPQDQQAA